MLVGLLYSCTRSFPKYKESLRFLRFSHKHFCFRGCRFGLSSSPYGSTSLCDGAEVTPNAESALQALIVLNYMADWLEFSCLAWYMNPMRLHGDTTQDLA